MHLLISKKLAASLGLLVTLAITYPAALNATTIQGSPLPTVPVVAEEAAPETGSPAIVASSVRTEAVVVKEAGAMDIWLAKLARQESGDRAYLKILDVNGMYSYGCLQFQEGTFRTYALRYGLISRSTPTESKIYDCELQKQIAKRMLAEDYSNWRAWYNSVQTPAVGMPPKAKVAG